MQLPSQRTVCRGVFLLCCLTPTLAVFTHSLLAVGRRHAPIERDLVNRQTFQDGLGARLGVRIQLDGQTHPRPGTTLLQRVRLVDPDSGRVLATLRQVHVSWGNGRMSATVGEAAVERRQLPRLWELFHHRVLQQADDLPLAVTVHCRQLSLLDPGGATPLKQVRGELERTEIGPRATWRFGMADAAQVAEVTVTRSQHGDDGVTRLQLDSGDTPLPCQLFHPLSERFQALGPHAAFQGRVWAAQSTRGWDGELAGRLSGIDLASLLGRTCAHRMTGPAVAILQTMRFQANQISYASGQISAGPGQIDGTLLRAAVEVLGLQPGRDAAAAGPTCALPGAGHALCHPTCGTHPFRTVCPRVQWYRDGGRRGPAASRARAAAAARGSLDSHAGAERGTAGAGHTSDRVAVVPPCPCPQSRLFGEEQPPTGDGMGWANCSLQFPIPR